MHQAIRPVFSLIKSPILAPEAVSKSTISSTIFAVRRHCQTMAGQMGLPVVLSQTTVVSRWLVKPTQAISAAIYLRH